MTARIARASVAAAAALSTAFLAAELVVVQPVLGLLAQSASSGDVAHALRLRLAAAAGATALGAVGWALWSGFVRRREEEREARDRIALVAMVAHDLRGPLTGMLLAADRADRRGDRDAASDLAAVVRRDCVRLGGIADDLLSLCQAADADEARSERVAELLDDVAERVRASTGMEIRVRAEGDAGDALAGAEVARAVANIAENAARHARRGPVALEARRTGDGLEIAAVDDGEGFPEGFSVAAFQRGPRGGRAGLGLASAARAARRAGGTLTIAPARDGGAAVSIRIPGEAR